MRTRCAGLRNFILTRLARTGRSHPAHYQGNTSAAHRELAIELFAGVGVSETADRDAIDGQRTES